jgi:hypothetical protein
VKIFGENAGHQLFATFKLGWFRITLKANFKIAGSKDQTCI